MHNLADVILSGNGKSRIAADWEGEEIAIGNGGAVEITDELSQVVQDYVTAIDFYRQGAVDHGCETVIDISDVTGEDGAVGTCDYYVVTDQGTELQVHDLKTGYTPVTAEGNYQLAIYALGMLSLLGLMYPIKTIRLVIHQPRLYAAPLEWTCDVAWLDEFRLVAAAAARKALHAADAEFTEGVVCEDWFAPGVEQCRYCSAKARCPALEKVVLEAIGGEGAHESPHPDNIVREAKGLVPTVSRERLVEQYKAIPLIEMFCAAVNSRVYRETQAGSLPEYKLVRRRPGPRRWVDPKVAETTLANMRYKREQMYKSVVISPTVAEKLIGKANPKRWKKLKALIFRKEGALSVAAIDDPRDAVTPVAAGFDDLGDDVGDLL